MADQEKHSFFGENRSLFSDYYLKERLRNTPEWKQTLEDLDKFENSGNLSGRKNHTTHKKLMKNMEPFIELREALTETYEKIEKSDWLHRPGGVPAVWVE